MKRQMCFWMALAALLMAPVLEPVAAQQAVKKGGQASQLPDKTVKKRYSRGVKEAAPSAAASASAATRWEPVVGMDAQLFPSFIVSTATMRLPQEDDAADDPHRLGEALGFVGVSVEGVPADSRLRVEAKPNAVMEASVFEGRAAAGAGEYEVYPKINYKYDALLDWRQPMPLNISMEVFVDGRSLGTQSKTVTVRSINDCPFVVVAEDKNGEEDLDLSWMFAAYVNEDHPFVSDDPDYQLISVSEARKLGILPLAYRKAGGGGPGPLHGREGRGSGSLGGAGARCREYESRDEHRNDAAHVFKSDVQTTSVR